MDKNTIARVVDTHAQAVVDPLDMARIEKDLIPELHSMIPQLAELLPIPVATATVDTLDVSDDHAIALITYSGDAGSISVRSRWEDRGGAQPQMVEAAPVA